MKNSSEQVPIFIAATAGLLNNATGKRKFNKKKKENEFNIHGQLQSDISSAPKLTYTQKINNNCKNVFILKLNRVHNSFKLRVSLLPCVE